MEPNEIVSMGAVQRWEDIKKRYKLSATLRSILKFSYKNPESEFSRYLIYFNGSSREVESWLRELQGYGYLILIRHNKTFIVELTDLGREVVDLDFT